MRPQFRSPSAVAGFDSRVIGFSKPHPRPPQSELPHWSDLVVDHDCPFWDPEASDGALEVTEHCRYMAERVQLYVDRPISRSRSDDVTLVLPTFVCSTLQLSCAFHNVPDFLSSKSQQADFDEPPCLLESKLPSSRSGSFLPEHDRVFSRVSKCRRQSEPNSMQIGDETNGDGPPSRCPPPWQT